MSRTFVGFGFGAIQSGLFLYEAFRSGKFDRIVVVEVVPELVHAVRRNGGYMLNVATASGIEQHWISGVEIYNLEVASDRQSIVEALVEAQEVATALPSVNFFDRGTVSVATLMHAAFSRKLENHAMPSAVVYTGENNNHAAKILEKAVGLGRQKRVQFLNTVIGKMSGVVTDPLQIQQRTLIRITPDSDRAFLVEEFNRILISKIELEGFERGIEVLIEKPDLIPFEEAKLYGHNAAHALMGYLANEQGCLLISESPEELVRFAIDAFMHESGAALIKKHSGIDELFTPTGFKAYVDDLMTRIMNPYLGDQTERVIRDPVRKLAANDRLIGTMRLCLSEQVVPERYARGVRAALRHLWQQQEEWKGRYPWEEQTVSSREKASIRRLINHD